MSSLREKGPKLSTDIALYKLSQFSSCHYCYICHHSNQHLDYLDQHDDCHQVCNKHRGGDDGVHEVLFGSKRRLDGYSSLIRRQSNTLLSTHTCKTWLQKLKQFKLKQLTKMFLFWGTVGGRGVRKTLTNMRLWVLRMWIERTIDSNLTVYVKHCLNYHIFRVLVCWTTGKDDKLKFGGVF